jgi:hypothetical protein
LIAFLETIQRLEQEWQKNPALGPGKLMAKLGLVSEIEINLAVLPLNYLRT